MSCSNKNNEKNNGSIEEEKKLNPPSQETVGKRALCLGALVMRGNIEQLAREKPTSDVKEVCEKEIDELKKWLKDEGLEPFLSKEEKRLFSKPFGSWERQELIDAFWRTESVSVLLWALSIFDTFPSYDKEWCPSQNVLTLYLSRIDEGA
ncbi:MAG: DUF4272 domain-containing protein, partial [bacterium]|nr:DUF4272 domain-containing protein [bacterium]